MLYRGTPYIETGSMSPWYESDRALVNTLLDIDTRLAPRALYRVEPSLVLYLLCIWVLK